MRYCTASRGYRHPGSEPDTTHATAAPFSIRGFSREFLRIGGRYYRRKRHARYLREASTPNIAFPFVASDSDTGKPHRNPLLILGITFSPVIFGLRYWVRVSYSRAPIPTVVSHFCRWYWAPILGIDTRYLLSAGGIGMKHPGILTSVGSIGLRYPVSNFRRYYRVEGEDPLEYQ